MSASLTRLFCSLVWSGMMKTVFGLYNSVLTYLTFTDFLSISLMIFSVTLRGLIFGSLSFLPSLIVLVISIW